MNYKRPEKSSRTGRTLRARDKYGPTLISVTSIILVVFILRLIIVNTQQWTRIKAQFFNLDAIIDVFPKVLKGFGVNMSVWIISLIVIALWALLLAVFRSLQGPWFAPLKVFSIVYIDLFRGLPSLLLVLLFGFGIPALQIPGLPRSSLFWGAAAMTTSYSAYASEVYRSGIDAVHNGQRNAAKALGLTQWQSLIYCILPQAIRNVIPSLLNLAVALQKDVALLSVLGIRDAVREAQIYTARTFNYSSLIAAAMLFLITTIPLARLTDYITKQDRNRRLQGAS